MRYRNSGAKLIEIYETDKWFNVDRIYDHYNINNDLQMMMKTNEDTRGTKKRSGDEFVKHLYKEEHYYQVAKLVLESAQP